jgi:hypothetical protein
LRRLEGENAKTKREQPDLRAEELEARLREVE